MCVCAGRTDSFLITFCSFCCSLLLLTGECTGRIRGAGRRPLAGKYRSSRIYLCQLFGRDGREGGVADEFGDMHVVASVSALGPVSLSLALPNGERGMNFTARVCRFHFFCCCVPRPMHAQFCQKEKKEKLGSATDIYGLSVCAGVIGRVVCVFVCIYVWPPMHFLRHSAAV